MPNPAPSGFELPIPEFWNRSLSNTNLEVITRVILVDLPSDCFIAEGLKDPHHGRVCLFTQGTYDGRYGVYIERSPAGKHRILVHQTNGIIIAKVTKFCFFIRSDTFQFFRFNHFLRALHDTRPVHISPVPSYDPDIIHPNPDNERRLITRYLYIPPTLAYGPNLTARPPTPGPFIVPPFTEAWEVQADGSTLHVDRRTFVPENSVFDDEQVASTLRCKYYDTLAETYQPVHEHP